jgi:hypothetical protein
MRIDAVVEATAEKPAKTPAPRVRAGRPCVSFRLAMDGQAFADEARNADFAQCGLGPNGPGPLSF